MINSYGFIRDVSNIYRTRSSIISAPLGLPLGCRSITLTQQKLESGSNDSGCVRRMKMITELFFLNEMCVDAKLELNSFFLTHQNLFSLNLIFFLTQLNFFSHTTKIFLTQLIFFLTTLKIFFSHNLNFFSKHSIFFLHNLRFFLCKYVHFRDISVFRKYFVFC